MCAQEKGGSIDGSPGKLSYVLDGDHTALPFFIVFLYITKYKKEKSHLLRKEPGHPSLRRRSEVDRQRVGERPFSYPQCSTRRNFHPSRGPERKPVTLLPGVHAGGLLRPTVSPPGDELSHVAITGKEDRQTNQDKEDALKNGEKEADDPKDEEGDSGYVSEGTHGGALLTGVKGSACGAGRGVRYYYTSRPRPSFPRHICLEEGAFFPVKGPATSRFDIVNGTDEGRGGEVLEKERAETLIP
jgi:hypothetical protein